MVELYSLPYLVLRDYLFPCLNIREVIGLRQVNEEFKRRFNDEFTDSDPFWKRFLYYPLKYFECDRRSGSTDVRVAQVLQDISEQGGNDPWLSYCKLQEAHLHNWVSGQNNQYDTIDLPIGDMSYMEEMVDDFSEHWVCFKVSETLHVWNITAQPRLVKVDVGAHTLVRLSPCRKVVVNGVGPEGSTLTVYEILLDKIERKYHFRFYDEVPSGRGVIGTLSSRYLNFILMNHIFIGYISQPSQNSPQDYFLLLWNLNEDHQWYSKSLEEIVSVFKDFLFTNGVKMGLKCLLNLYVGESSYIVVVLKYFSHGQRFSQINLFDIESRQFTHLIAQTRSEVSSCSMYKKKISVHEKVPLENDLYSRVSVYSLPSMQAANGEAGQLLEGECLYERSMPLNNFKRDVVLKNDKLLIRTSSDVMIITTHSPHRIEVPVNTRYEILGFIEPKILMMYNSGSHPSDTQVRVYNISDQRQILTWEHVNITSSFSSRFQHYFTNLVYPSKLILNTGNKEKFMIYKF